VKIIISNAVLVLCLAFAGCSLQSKVATFTSGDATGAVKLASANGDASVVPCYEAIGFAAESIAAVTPASSATKLSLGPLDMGVNLSVGGGKPGLLTEYEVSRVLKGLGKNPACAQVWMDLASIVLKAAVPGAGGLLP